MRILLISGHGGKDPGTVHNGYREADLTREVVTLLKPKLTPYADVDIYNTKVSAYNEIITQKKKFDFSKYDYILEIHFNAGVGDLKGNGKTTGTEIYVTREEKVVTAEQNIVINIAKLGFQNRGVKRKNFDLIKHIKKQGVSAALLEVCFIDDKDDMSLYSSKKNQIAQAIADGIAKGYKLAFSKEEKLTEACNKLYKAGIINSPEYWAKGKGYSDANVVQLIQKFSNYIK